MSAVTTITAPSTERNAGFGGTLRSEWIKLRSLRSTFWCGLLILIVGVGLTTLFASQQDVDAGATADPGAATEMLVQAVTLPTTFTALIAAVMGALLITGEYATGMIRSTFAAVPTRLPALIGKSIIAFVSTFVIAGLSIVASVATAVPMLQARGVHPNIGDPALISALTANALYLAGISVLALLIGAIVRNSAGSITVSLGMLLALPVILLLLASGADAAWVANLNEVIPSNAGSAMYQYMPAGYEQEAPAPGRFSLGPVQGALVMLGWIAAAGIAAGTLLRRRDA
jgi:ABC-2 type transport system permease protein